MVRYLFYAIGDLTYQSPFVEELTKYCRYRTVSILLHGPQKEDDFHSRQTVLNHRVVFYFVHAFSAFVSKTMNATCIHKTNKQTTKHKTTPGVRETVGFY